MAVAVAVERMGFAISYARKQVPLIERGLDTLLLYRITRRLRLSDEGARFYNHSRFIMAEAENASSETIESAMANGATNPSQSRLR